MRDGQFAYLSTFHWRPIVNGYSGHYRAGTSSASLHGKLSLGLFDGRTARAGVSYVILHERIYERSDTRPCPGLDRPRRSGGFVVLEGRLQWSVSSDRSPRRAPSPALPIIPVPPTG